VASREACDPNIIREMDDVIARNQAKIFLFGWQALQ